MKGLIAITVILTMALTACKNEGDNNKLSRLEDDQLAISLDRIKKVEYYNLDSLRKGARKLLEINNYKVA